MDLSILLLDLLDRQEVRRAELLSTLKNIEDAKDTVDDLFWLRQYQQLLDRRPTGLAESQNDLNIGVAQHLLMSGVIHCLPFLARWAQNEGKKNFFQGYLFLLISCTVHSGTVGSN